ncbi:GYF domain-containing protein [Planctomicrobium sp. SH527]|uniref:GYF domain-containing protein n=1 Tax=Planctomicrobium sp. SH527 TaxID=3448123 RepID=UPI003F5C2B2F
MSDQWYIEFQGKEQGPFLMSQLKKLAALGRLQPTDLIWQESHSQKIPASELKGIFSNSPPLPKTQSRSPVVPPPLPTTPNGPPPLPDDAKLPHGVRTPELPNNGDGGRPKFWQRHRFNVGIGAVAVCVFMAAVAGHLGTTRNGSQPTTSGGTLQNVSATDLYAAFQSDSEAADKRFKGKWLAVSGQVGTRDNAPKNYPGTILMGLKGSDATDAFVACYFARENESMLQLLDGIPQPPIIGKCLGIAQSEYVKSGQSLIEVQLRECNILPVALGQPPEKLPTKNYKKSRPPQAQIHNAAEITVDAFAKKLSDFCGHNVMEAAAPDAGFDRAFIVSGKETTLMGIHKAIGKPNQILDQNDWASQKWVYNCTNGFVVFTVTNINDVPYKNNRRDEVIVNSCLANVKY